MPDEIFIMVPCKMLFWISESFMVLMGLTLRCSPWSMLHRMLAAHMGAICCYGCSISNPLGKCTWESSGNWPKCLGFWIHLRNSEEGSWFLTCLSPGCCHLEMNQRLKNLFLSTSFSNSNFQTNRFFLKKRKKVLMK